MPFEHEQEFHIKSLQTGTHNNSVTKKKQRTEKVTYENSNVKCRDGSPSKRGMNRNKNGRRTERKNMYNEGEKGSQVENNFVEVWRMKNLLVQCVCFVGGGNKRLLQPQTKRPVQVPTVS